ncbi:MAG: hypothetical protein H0U75_04200 [Legionella sp.]|nr:hypothetical protein [Legionella sp.]
MNKNDIDKAYISPFDKFSFEYDATHDKSPSQIKEIIKNQVIANKRDNKDHNTEKSEIWESF